MTRRVLSPGFAWMLVAVLAVIAIAVAAVGRSGHPAPGVHVWHAHLLPSGYGPPVFPPAR